MERPTFLRMKHRNCVSLASCAFRFAFSFLLAEPLLASAAAWTSIGPPVPAIEGAVAVHPTSGTIYIGTFGGGVLKSVDGGATFAASNAGPTFLRMSRSGVVAIDPSDLSTLYAGTEGSGVFKGHDAGSTWSAVNDGLGELNVYGLTLDPNHSNVLYAAGPHGVYKTVTGGQ